MQMLRLCLHLEVSAADVKGEDKLVSGCPAMGAEVFKRKSLEPFITELEGCCSQEKVVLFDRTIGAMASGCVLGRIVWKQAGAEVVDEAAHENEPTPRVPSCHGEYMHRQHPTMRN